MIASNRVQFPHFTIHKLSKNNCMILLIFLLAHSRKLETFLKSITIRKLRKYAKENMFYYVKNYETKQQAI